MTETGQNFTMWSGDTKVLEVTITDSDGAAVDLTGATISYVLQRNVNSAAATISKTTDDGISITDASGGVFQITLDASDTASLSGSYYHECQITDASGNASTVFTGTVTMKDDAI